MAHLNWVYENIHTVAKARVRRDDLLEVANEFDIDIKIVILKLNDSFAGHNIIVELTDDRFNTWEDAQSLLRTGCIALRKSRRKDG